MPKLKTHTGAKKRFSKTGTGKIKRGQMKTRHILTSKSPKMKRKLGKIRAGFRRRFQEGSAHDSLRLIVALVPATESALQGPANALQGPPADRPFFMDGTSREIKA